MGRMRVARAFALVSVFLARTAGADPAPMEICTRPSPADARALAETLFFTGRGMMEAGRYGEAAAKLAESYRMDPAAGTLLNLAVCHEKEGKLATAWGEFRQALADARRDDFPDREDFAAEHLAQIEPDLPFLTIEVPAGVQVPGLEIVRNGVVMQAATWSTELPVDPGTVEIVARAERYTPNTVRIDIAKREHRVVTMGQLALAPVTVAPTSFWTGSRQAGVVAAGAGVVAAGAGIAFGIATLAARSRSDADCPVFDGERRCTQAGLDEMSRAKTLAIFSDVGIGLGVVGVATGAYLFFRGGRKSDAPKAAADRRAWHGELEADARGVRYSLQRAF